MGVVNDAALIVAVAKLRELVLQAEGCPIAQAVCEGVYCGGVYDGCPIKEVLDAAGEPMPPPTNPTLFTRTLDGKDVREQWYGGPR